MASLASHGRRMTTPVFAAVVAERVAMTPYAPLNVSEPGPHEQQKARVENSAAKIETAKRVAYAEHDAALRRHGLAGSIDTEIGLADLFNPLPSSPYIDALGVAGYYFADRRGRPDNGLTRRQNDSLLRPLKETPAMKTLFAQEVHVNTARANLAVRERQGLPRTARNAAAAMRQQAMAWAWNDNQPAPHFI